MLFEFCSWLNQLLKEVKDFRRDENEGWFTSSKETVQVESSEYENAWIVECISVWTPYTQIYNDKYNLYGITPGMKIDDALNKLKAAGITITESQKENGYISYVSGNKVITSTGIVDGMTLRLSGKVVVAAMNGYVYTVEFYTYETNMSMHNTISN